MLLHNVCLLLCLPLPAEVAGKQSEHSRTVSHLDQLHNAYQECLGLRLISEDGEQQHMHCLLQHILYRAWQ
jgi:hypothetical protein